MSPFAVKALEKIPSLLKLTEAHKFKHNAKEQEVLDDDSGRTRLAQYISEEYSLEEVIYQLAKTMFKQSLQHASIESQSALQKLTEFIESEGKQGKISPALEKKILGKDLKCKSGKLFKHVHFQMFCWLHCPIR